MRIALGADHGGYLLKEQIALHLKRLGHGVEDLGTSSKEAVDYPLFARAVAEAVASGRCRYGIMIDGAGIGSAMVANKVPGVRAALAYDLSSARNSREHNNANVLTLGAGLIGPQLAEQIVSRWLETDCTEERHLRRAAMIEGVGQGRLTVGLPLPPADREASIPTEISAGDLERIRTELARILSERPADPTHGTHRRQPFAPAGVEPLGPEEINRMIDHTLLRPDATSEEIRRLCTEAIDHSFATVCVQPVWTRLAARELQGSCVKVCSVVGFPLGTTPPENKALEARRAIRDGAAEIDMVIHVGALKGGGDAEVLRDIRAVVEACRDGSAICKVILEAARLTDEEKRRACRIARRAAADFVKTSTGFGPGGATLEDVALMAEEVRDAGMEVKAAGGIRSYADAIAMIHAGATRIGTSSGVAIAQEARGVAA